uniref:Uncharacterized protein n=1 Tax=Anguilla anguilla TaxID=7936 RepID=A0A0E9PLH2_ANGAN
MLYALYGFWVTFPFRKLKLSGPFYRR